MSKTNFDRMARDNTRLIREAKDLAKLWRKIVAERDITADQLYGLITRWVNEHQYRETDHGTYRSNDRGNIIKALGKNRISWKVFMKGIKILRPASIELVVNITWRRGQMTSHAVNLDLTVPDSDYDNPLYPEDYEPDEEDVDNENVALIVNEPTDVLVRKLK